MMLGKMIDDQWRYVQGVLLAHGTELKTIELCEFHYRSAFAHGYKHADEVKYSSDTPATHKRGSEIANDFAADIVRVMNLPKNAAKGGWEELPELDIIRLLHEEIDELLEALDVGGDVVSEAADCGAFLAMIAERYRNKLSGGK